MSDDHGMSSRHRLDDVPLYLRYFLIAFKEVGFPAMVAFGALGLLWKQMDSMKTAYDVNSTKVVEAVDKNTSAITALRHFLTHRYDE